MSVQKLYDEIGWESLESRRKHKITLFYKIYDTLVPSYLAGLVPPMVNNFSHCDLRHENNIHTNNKKHELVSTLILFYKFL